MSDHKDILQDGQVIGSCTITKEGLYYRFQCNCRFEDRGVHKLFIRMNRGAFPLGICIPAGNRFILDKRIAISKIGNDILSVLSDDTNSFSGTLEISRLQYAFLDSNAQLSFKDQFADRQGSDRSQVYPRESSHP